MAELTRILELAGWPGWALVAVSMGLWATVWIRASALSEASVNAFADQAEALADARERARVRDGVADVLSRGREVLRALVLVAPLLGLLGTVGGMVEMFEALHGGSAALGRGSVAGGISTALITTQLGLIIGVPGLVAARLLDEREARLRGELDDILLRRGRRGASTPDDGGRE